MLNGPLTTLRLPGPFARRRGRGAAFDPASLFANGEQGDDFWFWRDFCFTLSSGGVYEPVTTTGDQIARITGTVNGINLDQDVAEARPVYGESGSIGWGEYDGVDDRLKSASSIAFLNSTMNVFMGMRLTDTASRKRFLMHGAFSDAFWMGLNDFGDGGLTWTIRQGNDGTGDRPAVFADIPTDASFVATALGDIDTYTAELEINNNGILSETKGSADFSFGNDTLYVFSRNNGEETVEGRLYNLLIVESDVSESREDIKKLVGQRSGVTI